jgi:hypothetical protein
MGEKHLKFLADEAEWGGVGEGDSKSPFQGGFRGIGLEQ